MIVFKKQYNYNRYFLNICTAAILFIHGIAGMFNEGMAQFGSYLDQKGLAPLGLLCAWIIKLSHIWAAVCILTGKWRFWILLFTIFILLTGIFMVHLPQGWFVVGGGFNGIEFNLLLIAALVAILFDDPAAIDKTDH